MPDDVQMNQGYGKNAAVRTRRIRAALGAAAGAVSCAAALAGCAGPDTPARARPAAAPPKPLAQTALNARAFAVGERVGPYRTAEFTVSGGPMSDDYTAEPALCQPLVGLRSAEGGPLAQVHRRLGDPARPKGADVAVQLRSYGEGRAAGVMRALRVAGEKCKGGFTEKRGTVRATYLGVEKVPAPAGVGDEAQAFRLVVREVKGGAKEVEYLTVVRAGATTLSFRAEALDAADLGGVPKEIVDAQWEKWGKK
ncbi:hypothetical protein [Streptomyces sp. NPDC051561]|uniref:hypothetical protein n=1 Tax=Streptomyces sp. NPDC051561 TaxID=3365658 RepID=UPI0037B81FD3